MTILETIATAWIIWKACPFFLAIIEAADEMKEEYHHA